MNLFSEDIELIKKLLKSNTINLYELHNDFLLSPAQVATAIERLVANDYVALEGMSLTVTEKGKEWLKGDASVILVSERIRYWRELPSDMLQPQLGIDELYKPNIDKIRKEGKILGQ